MAILPDPNQLSRGTIRGPGGVQTVQAGVLEAAQARAAGIKGQTAFQIGQSISQLGQNVVAMAGEERKKLVDLRVQDDTARLRDATTNLLVGDDGVLTKKEGQVLEKDFIKRYADRFDHEVKKLEAAQPTDEHRAIFQRYADDLRSSYLRSIMTHSASEADKYKDTTYTGSKASFLNYAQAQFDNSDAVKQSVEGMRALATQRAQEKGVTDPTALATMVQEEVGAIHAGVIEAARQGDAVQYANDYFAQVKGDMTAEQALAVEARLKPSTSYAKGVDIGQKVIALFDAGTPEKDLQAMIVDETKNDPQAANAARALLIDAKNAREADRAQTTGSGILTFLNSGMTSEAFTRVMNDPATLALPPADQAKLQEHFMSLMSAKASHTKAENREVWDSPEAYSQFAEVMQRDDLGAMPEAEIYALQPDIGPAKVGKIIAERKARLGGAVRFNIDTDILKEATPPALFSSSKKGELAAFRGLVESNLADWKAMTPGIKPDLATQKRIARSALAEYDAPGLLWGTNKKPMYKAPENERELRRLEALRPDWNKGMRAEAAKRGIPLTDGQLDAMWAKKLEMTK